MRLSEINIYPIKSLGGISLKSSIVENRGLQFDRRWLLVDEKNQFLTQRDFPKMATVATEMRKDCLRVSSSGKKLEIPFEPNTNETASVKIWSSRCRAQVYNTEINEWFSDILQTTCKLVFMPEETRRKVNYFYAVHKDDAVSFADAYPVLIIGENSLADLNVRLENPVPMNRFRPNLVVKNSEAFAEDDWKKIKIGDAIFHVVKPCARCVMTTINQTDGVKTGVEPLKTLATYRTPKRSIKKKILFGQYLIAEDAGAVLNVGDEIEVIETQMRKRIFDVKF